MKLRRPRTSCINLVSHITIFLFQFVTLIFWLLPVQSVIVSSFQSANNLFFAFISLYFTFHPHQLTFTLVALYPFSQQTDFSFDNLLHLNKRLSTLHTLISNIMSSSGTYPPFICPFLPSFKCVSLIQVSIVVFLHYLKFYLFNSFCRLSFLFHFFFISNSVCFVIGCCFFCLPHFLFSLFSFLISFLSFSFISFLFSFLYFMLFLYYPFFFLLDSLSFNFVPFNLYSHFSFILIPYET